MIANVVGQAIEGAVVGVGLLSENQSLEAA